MNDSVFRLFACCIPVRGARRSIVCDLQRHSYYFIPNALYDILTIHRDRTKSEIKKLYHDASSHIIENYFKFVLEKELGFWCNEPESFPDLDLSWETPSTISNAIIDIDASSRHNFAAIFQQLEYLGCWAVQVRFFCNWSLPRIEQEIMVPTAYGRLRSIELLLRFSHEVEIGLQDFLVRHQRITSIIIHDAPEDRTVNLQGVRCLFRKQLIDSDRHCGQVHPHYFSPTRDSFLEAQRFNTCLNKKVGIDIHGEIKNCPSCERGFGKIGDIHLNSVVRTVEFQSLWNISKDSVEVCRDCEFRYICTDCRVFVSNKADQYSKPAKCRYDPYTAQWI